MELVKCANEEMRVWRQKVWKQLWKMECPTQSSPFLMEVWSQQPMRMNILRKGVELDTRCVVCNRLFEDGGHLFFRCKEAKARWRALDFEEVRHRPRSENSFPRRSDIRFQGWLRAAAIILKEGVLGFVDADRVWRRLEVGRRNGGDDGFTAEEEEMRGLMGLGRFFGLLSGLSNWLWAYFSFFSVPFVFVSLKDPSLHVSLFPP